MRKNKRTIKALLSELEKTGIASNACSKIGLVRSTYYRWYNTDIEFRMSADKAIESGRANMVDFAESKLVKNVNEGHQRAVEFYLKHNDSRYRSFHGRELQEFKDILEHKNRTDFEALDLIPRILLESLPTETLVELFDLGSFNPNDTGEPNEVLDKEVQQALAKMYVASNLGLTKSKRTK